MTARRTGIKVAVEEEVPSPGEAPPRRVSVSATLEPSEGSEVTSKDVAEAVKALRAHLESATEALESESGIAKGPRPDRTVAELLEAYRPRSAELVDALLWEGELTPSEHQQLQAALKSSPALVPKVPPSRVPAEATPTVPAPSRAASPPTTLAGASTSSTVGPSPRPVDVLLRELDLKDLRDVNRARGRRVISYEEWASLKAHFEKPS